MESIDKSISPNSNSRFSRLNSTADVRMCWQTAVLVSSVKDPSGRRSREKESKHLFGCASSNRRLPSRCCYQKSKRSKASIGIHRKIFSNFDRVRRFEIQSFLLLRWNFHQNRIYILLSETRHFSQMRVLHYVWTKMNIMFRKSSKRFSQQKTNQTWLDRERFRQRSSDNRSENNSEKSSHR